MKHVLAKCWTFVSSKGDRRYQTLLYIDGSSSCDCPGWCKRTAPDGSRSCKHTRSVLMGTADRECESLHDYTASGPNPTVPQQTTATIAAKAFGQLGRRRIQA